MDQHGFIEKQESNSTYNYIFSCDIDTALFRIKIGSLDGILPPHKNSMDQADNEKITLSQSVHNNYDYIANELNNLELLDEMINSDDNDDDDNNLKNNSNPTENIHKEKLRKTQKNKKKITKVLFGSSKQPFRALSRHAYLTCDIVSNGTRLCPHQQIPYKEILDRYEWNQWLVFPILLNTLPRDTIVCFTFWDTFETGYNAAVARTSIPVFSKRGCLRKGLYDLRLFFNEDCEEYFKNLKENNIEANLSKNSYTTFPDVEITDINFSNRVHKNEELVRKAEEIIPKWKKHFNPSSHSFANFVSVPNENFDCNSFEFLSTEQYYQSNLSYYPIGTLNKPKIIDRLTKMKKKYHNNQFPKLDWLDRLSFLKIEHLVVESKTSSSNVYLTVEFPTVLIDAMEHAVVYYEDKVDVCCQDDIVESDIVLLHDPEINLPDLIEQKHHALARSARSGISMRDLKPNAAIRNHLNAIVNYPSTHLLTSEEQDLIWKYRFYLRNQKKALAKFLKIVNWKLPTEAEQAIDLMNEWQPMDIEDALELFSPFFTNPMVRKYAVCRLKSATDDDLLLYLLQLVQALKYENYYEILQMFELEFANYQRNASNSTPVSKEIKMFAENTESVIEASAETLPRSMISTLNESIKNEESADIFSKNRLDSLMDNEDLATFLLNRTCNNDALANYFFWYLCIEFEGAKNAELANLSIEKILSPTYLTSTMRYSLLSTKSDNVDSQKSKFSISELSSSFSLNNTIEMYLIIMKRFSIRLLTGGAETNARRNFLLRQQDFVSKLVDIMKEIARESGNRLKKIEKLQSILESPEPQFRFNFNKNDPLPSPLDPDIKFIGVAYKEAMLYKSATMPAKLGFITTRGDIFYTIFKNGDDLRQDDLVLQMINLMDKLLRKENLDLKLTPYRVLACSSKHGFVQFIDSHSVAEVISNDGSIQNYLKRISQSLPTVTTTPAMNDFQVVSTTHPKNSKRSSPSHQSTSGSSEISAQIMDAYVKSCAGYCVITYLLGIGDRHLDNLMLTKTGRLFHIDFGFILGRDPKVRPPAMKITREMVDAMGGMESENFLKFCSLVRTAFLHLRRHANLILNLFALMVDANVPDIALEPDKTVQKVQDKFKLELDDEQAVHYIIEQVEQSLRSIMPVVVDQLHKMTQYLRN